MKSNKGFSLVELIVVIAIMAIIAGVAIPVYTHYIDDSEAKVNATIVSEVEHAIAIECAIRGIEDDVPTVALADDNDSVIEVTFTTPDSGTDTTDANLMAAVDAVVGNYFTGAFTANADKTVYSATIK